MFNRPLEDTAKAAFMTSMTDAVFRNQKSHKQFVHKICKQQLLTVNTVMYFKKNFFLIDSINEKVSAFVNSGIMNYWIQNNLQMSFYKPKIVKVGPTRLSLEHLSGVYEVLLFGFFIAFIAFVGEIFWSKLKRHSMCRNV